MITAERSTKEAAVCKLLSLSLLPEGLARGRAGPTDLGRSQTLGLRLGPHSGVRHARRQRGACLQVTYKRSHAHLVRMAKKGGSVGMSIIRVIQPRSADCWVKLAASSWAIGNNNIVACKTGKGGSGCRVGCSTHSSMSASRVPSPTPVPEYWLSSLGTAAQRVGGACPFLAGVLCPGDTGRSVAVDMKSDQPSAYFRPSCSCIWGVLKVTGLRSSEVNIPVKKF